MILRKVTSFDYDFIRDLVTNPQIYTHIKNREKWSDNKIKVFINECEEGGNNLFYICSVDEGDIGVIGVSLKKKKYSLTVFIHPDHQGKGYFWTIFDMFMGEVHNQLPKINHFYVQIHEENKKMIEIMETKYKKSDSYYIGSIYVFEYKVQVW